jgi:hypothetical protein
MPTSRPIKESEKETKSEPPYFRSAPSITSKDSMKEYYRKMLEPFAEEGEEVK